MSDKQRWRINLRPRSGRYMVNRRSLRNMLGWALAAFALYLMVQFSGLVKQGYEMESQIVQQEQAIAQLESEQQALKDRLAYVKSDAAVELRARNLLDMARPGEVVLQPQVIEPTVTAPLSNTAMPETLPVPRVEDDATPNWRRWWTMLFNS